MATTNNTEITAAEWLDVRDTVAAIVRGAARNTQPATTVNVAEQLLRRGFVDVEAVRTQIRKEAADREHDPTEVAQNE